MTGVQSGGKLQPRRIQNWQIVFCPERIIISNTRRSAVNACLSQIVFWKPRWYPIHLKSSPLNFNLSGMLPEIRNKSEGNLPSVHRDYQTQTSGSSEHRLEDDSLISLNNCTKNQNQFICVGGRGTLIVIELSPQVWWENKSYLKKKIYIYIYTHTHTHKKKKHIKKKAAIWRR